MLSTQTKQ